MLTASNDWCIFLYFCKFVLIKMGGLFARMWIVTPAFLPATYKEPSVSFVCVFFCFFFTIIGIQL